MDDTMKILIPAWEDCNWEKVKETWEELNHSVILYLEEAHGRKQDPRFRSVLRKFIRETQIDIIFSINYYPILSRACQETDIAYICWCPTLSIDDIPGNSLQYQKNYYFLFDRQEISNLQKIEGVNAFYLPYALDFPEQIEAYKNMMQAEKGIASSYADGYLDGLLQIKEYMQQYEKCLPPDKCVDFQNNYVRLHTIKKRLENIIDCCFHE